MLYLIFQIEYLLIFAFLYTAIPLSDSTVSSEKFAVILSRARQIDRSAGFILAKFRNFQEIFFAGKFVIPLRQVAEVWIRNVDAWDLLTNSVLFEKLNQAVGDAFAGKFIVGQRRKFPGIYLGRIGW